MVENCTNLICISHQFEYVGIHWRCAGDPVKQIAKLCLFQPVTYNVAGTIRDKIVDTFTYLTPYFVPVISFCPPWLVLSLPLSPKQCCVATAVILS